MRTEMTTRLTECTKAVPAKISAADLEEVMQVFLLLASKRDGHQCKSKLPGEVSDYAQELIEKIQTSKFDALDPDFPTRISKHLAELKTSIEALVLLQTEVKWINYETKTNHCEDMSVHDITSKEKKGQEYVFKYQDSHLYIVQTTKEEKDKTIGECEELAARFDALHDIFERAQKTRLDLSEKIIEHQDTFDKSLLQASEANARFATIKEDEKKNLAQLATLDVEHKYLREMVYDQVKWCQNFVKLSVSESQVKINSLDFEIERLKALKEQEVDRRNNLEKCGKHISKVNEAEGKLAEVYNAKRSSAQVDAQQRVDRSGEGASQSAQFVKRLEALHFEVQRELQV